MTGTLIKICIFACLIVICARAYPQQDSIIVRNDNTRENARLTSVTMVHSFDFGLGLGLDYGGILGLQVSVAPVRHLSVFGAIGYDLIALGWNVGLKGLIIAKTTRHVARPFIKAMYGVNSMILIEGTSEFDKLYNGATVGVGLELRFGKFKRNGFDIDLNVPIRSGEFWYDYNNLKKNYSVSAEPLPVAYSIGYHHEF